jgi:hypothetical protein
MHSSVPQELFPEYFTRIIVLNERSISDRMHQKSIVKEYGVRISIKDFRLPAQ